MITSHHARFSRVSPPAREEWIEIVVSSPDDYAGEVSSRTGGVD